MRDFLWFLNYLKICPLAQITCNTVRANLARKKKNLMTMIVTMRIQFISTVKMVTYQTNMKLLVNRGYLVKIAFERSQMLFTIRVQE